MGFRQFDHLVECQQTSCKCKKTKLMLFAPKSFISKDTFNLYFNGEKIELVTEYKLLGLVLDNHLSWDPHVNSLLSTLNRLKFVFRKLNRLLPIYCMRMLYFSYVQSRMCYGIIVWGSMLKKDLLSKLEKCQKCYLRLINGVHPLADSSPLFLRNKILKLQDIINLEYLKYMCKYKKKMLPVTLNSLFIDKSHDYTTRASKIPMIQKHTSKIFNNSFLCKAIVCEENNQTIIDSSSSVKQLVRNYKYERLSMY